MPSGQCKRIDSRLDIQSTRNHTLNYCTTLFLIVLQNNVLFYYFFSSTTKVQGMVSRTINRTFESGVQNYQQQHRHHASKSRDSQQQSRARVTGRVQKIQESGDHVSLMKSADQATEKFQLQKIASEQTISKIIRNGTKVQN